jgi:hypothetical protein
MARYAEKEVRFNVMAIVGDRLDKARAKVRLRLGSAQWSFGQTGLLDS